MGRARGDLEAANRLKVGCAEALVERGKLKMLLREGDGGVSDFLAATNASDEQYRSEVRPLFMEPDPDPWLLSSETGDVTLFCTSKPNPNLISNSNSEAWLYLGLEADTGTGSGEEAMTKYGMAVEAGGEPAATVARLNIATIRIRQGTAPCVGIITEWLLA